MASRADVIYKILEETGGRMKVKEIQSRIAEIENIDPRDLNQSTVSATLRTDNRTQSELGKVKRFNLKGDGTEVHGFVSIFNLNPKLSTKKEILENPERGIPSLIEEANKAVKEELRKALEEMPWREFETNFLPLILESLGFHDISITQPTRDGGMDAVCKYQRGIVSSEVIVSAKHWNKKNSVSDSEVRNLRGIKGNADTAIIITTAKFSQPAIDEAKPSQNQRAIVLIDGEMILEICLEKNIGVSEVSLPKMYRFEGLNNVEDDAPVVTF